MLPSIGSCSVSRPVGIYVARTGLFIGLFLLDLLEPTLDVGTGAAKFCLSLALFARVLLDPTVVVAAVDCLVVELGTPKLELSTLYKHVNVSSTFRGYP